MAYNPSTNIVVSGKTFTDVPSVQFKTPDGATVNFAHVGGQIRFSPTLEEQTEDVANYQDVIIDPITSTLLNQLDSDFVAENIKKDVDLFGLMGTMEGGSSFSTGTVTGIDDNTNLRITVEHGLGKRPQLIIIIQEPTGVIDKKVQISLVAVSKYGAGSYALSGNGKIGTNYTDLYHQVETANVVNKKWDDSTIYLSDILGVVTNTSFMMILKGQRTYRWIVF